MSNHYCSVEDVRALLDMQGTGRNAAIFDAIASASREIDALVGCREGAFIPETATRYYQYPQDDASAIHRERSTLFLDEWLISATTLTSFNATKTINSNDYYTEPANYGPPYVRIELDESSTNANTEFGVSTTRQRATALTGSWGYSATTTSAGTLDGAIGTTTATTVAVADGSKIGVGDTILVNAEQMFVSAKAFADIGQNESGALTAAQSDQTLTLGGAPTEAVAVGEVLRIDNEQMLVTGITSTTVFTVERAVNGTTLVAHTDTTDVYVNRSLTVERGVNGTTAATHSDNDAISVYQVPDDIRQLCIGMAAAELTIGGGGWTGQIGTGEGSRETRTNALMQMKERVLRRYPSPHGLF